MFVMGRKPRHDAPETRSRLLDAAESLLVELGIEATTLRLITSEAQVNLAAVNYHFGSKEALIAEVFRRRLTWLNEQRLRALDQLETAAGGEPLKPRQILDAFFGVAIKMATDTQSGGRSFMRLLGRTYTEPAGFVRSFLADEYSEAIARFKAALIAALPDVPRQEIFWRFHFMLGAMSYAISGADALNIVADVPLDDGDGEALYARLMSFLIGGLRAPLPVLKTNIAPAAPAKTRRRSPHQGEAAVQPRS